MQLFRQQQKKSQKITIQSSISPDFHLDKQLEFSSPLLQKDSVFKMPQEKLLNRDWLQKNNTLSKSRMLKKIPKSVVRISIDENESTIQKPQASKTERNSKDSLKFPSLKIEPRASQITETESESQEEREISVVWNDDDLKVRDLLPSIKEHKPVIQFMELYKYRYESYPDMRKQIPNKEVLNIAKAYAKMGHKAWKKYFVGQEIDFENGDNYTKDLNPYSDKNFTMFQDYVTNTHRQARTKTIVKSSDQIQFLSPQLEKVPKHKVNFRIKKVNLGQFRTKEI